MMRCRLAFAAAGTAILFMPQFAWADPVGAVDVNPIALFMGADVVVKLVMLLLIAASVASWALCVVKLRDIRGGIVALRRSAPTLQAAMGLDDLQDVDAITAAMAASAREEIAKSNELILQGRVEGARRRVEDRVTRIESRALSAMRAGLPVFASISAVGPFVGLFGTVWGVMHSFDGISAARSTSLAVVAPGISEALLATALGLVAAIPASLMYNLLIRRLGDYRSVLEDGASLLAGISGREMEMMGASADQAAAWTPGCNRQLRNA